MSNSRVQGAVGVGKAIAYFTEKEIPTFVPLADYADYDLVIDHDGLKKVQVRTSTCLNSKGKYAVNMRVFGGNAKTGARMHKLGTDMVYDYLFVYLGDGSQYLIPKPDIANIANQLVITVKHEQYKV